MTATSAFHRRFIVPDLPPSRRPAPKLVPFDPPAETPPEVPDRDAGLTASNSVTVSASAIANLPPGRYHYARFEGLDTLVPSAATSPETYEEQISDLEDEVKDYKRQAELAGEQTYFAQTLISEIEDFLGTLNVEGKLTEKALRRVKSMIETSMFER